VEYAAVEDAEALSAFQQFSRLEGIIPALETAHAIAWIEAARARWTRQDLVLLCLSGRGDKDVAHVVSLVGAMP
jgi:tryptophan synthase beta chain